MLAAILRAWYIDPALCTTFGNFWGVSFNGPHEMTGNPLPALKAFAVIASCCLVAVSFPGCDQAARGLVVVGDNPVAVNVKNRHEPIKVLFVLRNDASSTVTINKMQTRCSCIKSELDGTVIQPGKTVNVNLTIDSFDSYASRFTEAALMETSLGDIPLYVEGSLPEPTRIMARPPTLIFRKSDSSGDYLGQIQIRIPKHCGTSFSSSSVVCDGIHGLTIHVTDGQHTDKLLEYTIECRVPGGLERVVTDDQSLKIITACDPLSIPIVFKESQPIGSVGVGSATTSMNW